MNIVSAIYTFTGLASLAEFLMQNSIVTGDRIISFKEIKRLIPEEKNGTTRHAGNVTEFINCCCYRASGEPNSSNKQWFKKLEKALLQAF